MQTNCIDAVRLHEMVASVKQDLRAVRKAETEARLVGAATALFIERGYAGATLTEVAVRAGLAPRTVYLRFPTKADLLRRCVSVAVAGDADPMPIAKRDWMTKAMTAPTLDERLHLMAPVAFARGAASVPRRKAMASRCAACVPLRLTAAREPSI